MDTHVATELESLKPRTPCAHLTSREMDRIIARSFHALCRWFLHGSQPRRNWNPDSSFDWRCLPKDHSAQLLNIVEGFYAVEQYSPDCIARLLTLTRDGYGRSQYYIRWGADEQKHADLWRNALLFSGGRSPESLEEYTARIRGNKWQLPWESPLRTLLYTTIHERATQAIYLKTAKIGKGETTKTWLKIDEDPVLAKVARAIAADEAAHFEFFLHGARLFLYYHPERTTIVLIDVLHHFVMPAGGIIYNL